VVVLIIGEEMGQITTWDEFPPVEYVPGVFRQAVCGEKAMLTRIVYKGSVVIPDHQHEAEQIMLVEQGRLWAKVGDEEAEVGPGSLLIILSNCVHALRKLSEEDVVFYEAFAPIRLEYLIGYKGADPALQMIRKTLQAK
jgi:quercetin dioxygenase-like cupin family protein